MDKMAISKEYSGVKVIPVDMKKLYDEVNDLLRKDGDLQAGENAYLGYDIAIVAVGYSINVLDQECVGGPFDGKLSFYKRTPTSVSMTPVFGIDLTVDELPLLGETTLEAFMKDRFAYNSRILDNMRVWKKAIAGRP